MQARQNSMPPVRHIQNVAQSQIKMSRGQSAKILHYLHLVSVILHFLHCPPSQCNDLACLRCK